MEKAEGRGRGRRRRPQNRKPSDSNQIVANSNGTEPPVVNSSQPLANDTTNPNSGQVKARRRRTRKPRKPAEDAGSSDQRAAPSIEQQQTAEGSTSRTEPLTWQQKSMLNANAPDFQPTPGPPPGLSALSVGAKKSRPQKKKKTAPKDVSNGAEAAECTAGEAPTCLLCCSLMELVSFGSCNHQVTCGPCCLRLRKCYRRTDCPLCKTELKDVVIAPWRPEIPEFSFFLENPQAAARSRPGQLGPGTVLADRWQTGRRQPSGKLLHDLIRSTGLACSVCDKVGKYPFHRANQLESHLRDTHGKFLCGMCLREGRTFPLDIPLYGNEEAVREHSKAVHPCCDFCRGRAFFDSDALWKHMMDKHHRCHLCEPGPGGGDPWFADVPNFRKHLAADHFACEDPDCKECLVAFKTADELKRHHIERHSSRMPRWNPAAARPLQLDIQFVRRPGEGLLVNDIGERRSRRRAAAAAARERPAEFAQEIDGGMRIIDDDLGILYESAQEEYLIGSSGGGSEGRSNNFSSFVSRQRNSQQAPQEAFPSLATAAAESIADRPSGNSLRPPPLVKHTVKCPCGRRVTYPVVEEGKAVPTIECDAVCRLEGRRKALADAFGVDDPDKHISSFERRHAEWSGALLDAAKRNPAWVQSTEKELAGFVADKSLKRKTMPSMPRAERAVLHGMAEQYGLATSATGVEPRRCVELFKVADTAALPSRLLSKMAAVVPDAEVAALLKAAEGHPVRFIEITPSTDLRYYLRRWEGHFKTEWQGGSTATVYFDTEQIVQEVLDQFGGGIRGLFRIDRSWKPKTGVSTSEGPGRSGAAAPWAAPGGSSASAASDGQQWRAVASSSGAGRNSSEILQESSAGTASRSGTTAAAVPSGWAVIGGKKAVKPRVATAAGTASGESSTGAVKAFSALSVDDNE